MASISSAQPEFPLDIAQVRVDNGKLDFAGLLRVVAAVPGIERIRFTSPHPRDFTQDTITAMATTPQVCPAAGYLDLKIGEARCGLERS